MNYLRQLDIKDAPAMQSCLNDKENTQYMLVGEKTFSLQDCEDFVKNSSSDQNNVHLAIVDENNEWVGTISLKHIDREVGQAEYAIITAKEVHGKGYAYKATMELLDYAFSSLKLQRVYLNVTSDNLRAINFYKRCGFVHEGTFRKAILIKGVLKDLEWFSVIKE